MVHDHDVFALGRHMLFSGEVLSDARLSFETWGQLNGQRDNCILLPTYYGGNRASYLPLIGPAYALDPARWFIVSIDMFGNGGSTSPSNWSGVGPFPKLDITDNISAQHRLLTERLGVRALALAAGWSMGGMQALYWGMMHPEFVARVFAWCGSARCWPLNAAFLDGVEAALTADPSQSRAGGLRAFARIYASWAYSAEFYRDELWRTLGFASRTALLADWESDHLAFDPCDLLAMLRTWRAADPAKIAGTGTLAAALGRIRARTLMMPCTTDMYFLPTESTIEAGLIPRAEMRLLHSPCGHAAGAPGRFASETQILDAAIGELLAG